MPRDAHLVDVAQVLVGLEFGVKDQLLGRFSRFGSSRTRRSGGFRRFAGACAGRCSHSRRSAVNHQGSNWSLGGEATPRMLGGV